MHRRQTYGLFVNTPEGLLKKVLSLFSIFAHPRQISKHTICVSADDFAERRLITLTIGGN
jgi:hypothetical protein